MYLLYLQKPANILVMGEGPERGRVKIGEYYNVMHYSLLCFNPGLSCSKLTMSLVNDSLKFASSDTQIC